MTARDPSSARVVCSDKNLLWQAAFFLERCRFFDAAGRVDYHLFTSATVPDHLHAAFGDTHIRENVSTNLASDKFQSLDYVTPATLLRITAIG